MSGKEKLIYKFYDRPGCKRPEQGVACQKTPDNNPGVFRLGLLIVHNGTPVTLSHETLRGEVAYLHDHGTLNERAAPVCDSRSMERLGIAYPGHLNHPQALRISFNVDLFCRQDALIDSVTLSDTTCEKPKSVFFDELGEAHRDGTIDPAIVEFVSHYETMVLHSKEDSYAMPQCFDRGFIGQRYTYGVTRLAHQALGQYLKENDVTASFLHKSRDSGKRRTNVASVDDLVTLHDGPHISASFRDPAQYANLHQLRGLLQSGHEDAPYDREFLQGTALIMNNAASISQPADESRLRGRVARAAAVLPAVTAMGAALMEAMGRHPKFG